MEKSYNELSNAVKESCQKTSELIKDMEDSIKKTNKYLDIMYIVFKIVLFFYILLLLCSLGDEIYKDYYPIEQKGLVIDKFVHEEVIRTKYLFKYDMGQETIPSKYFINLQTDKEIDCIEIDKDDWENLQIGDSCRTGK